MLRKEVEFMITAYCDEAMVDKVETNLVDTLDVISTLYAEEWSFQLLDRKISHPRQMKHDDAPLMYPVRCRWIFVTSQETLDSIMSNFDSVESKNLTTYYIRVRED